MMFWKKIKYIWKKRNEIEKVLEDPYPFGADVSFEVAFKALKEGYMIKDCGYNDIFYIMLNGRVFCLHDRDNKHNCYESDEFSKWSMLQNTWMILKPLSNKNISFDKK